MVVNTPEPDGEEVPGLGEDRTDPSTRLEGWRRFIEEDPAVFDLLPEQQWQALSPPMRDAYDEARIAYHSELQVVRTSTVKDIAHQGRLLTLLNQREHGVCRRTSERAPPRTDESAPLLMRSVRCRASLLSSCSGSAEGGESGLGSASLVGAEAVSRSV